jgi:hypothetical protein
VLRPALFEARSAGLSETIGRLGSRLWKRLRRADGVVVYATG